MSSRQAGRANAPTRGSIANHWLKHRRSELRRFFGQNNVRNDPEMFYSKYLSTTCWACLQNTTRPQRCHIIAHSRGGPEIADNLVLLCARCHAEALSTSDSAAMFSYIEQHEAGFNRDLREIHEILTEIDDGLIELLQGLPENIIAGLQEKIIQKLKETDCHSGRISLASKKWAIHAAVFECLEEVAA